MAELPASELQKGPETQQSPRRGVLFSSPSKRPLRVPHVVTRSPLQDASAVQQNQLARPVGEAISTSNQEKKAKNLDPEIEKKKRERSQLQREIEELEAQVSRCTKEITAEQERAADDTLPLAQRTDLM